MHCIQHKTFPESKTKQQITDDVLGRVRCNGDGYGTDHIDFSCTTIFKNFDEAEKFVDACEGFYKGVAVKYYDYSKVKDSKKVTKYREKIVETCKKRDQYIAEHSVKKQKAAYIGCPECGSKLAKEKLQGEYCPLCRYDLRSKTTLDRIASFYGRIEDYKRKITEEREKDNKKAEVMWLVKYEYHC